MSKKMMRKSTREQQIIYYAFLISIAVVIVSIIAVMSYSLYNSGRNSDVYNEKSGEINKIADALDKYKEEKGFYPSPEKTIGILAGKGNFILYQGYADSELTKDRLKLPDIKYQDYIYTITKTGDKYQLLTFAPDEKVISVGSRLGVFVDKDNVPFQDLEDAPNNIADTDELFYVYFDDNIKIIGNDRKLTPIKYISQYEYDPDLLAYWNMETLTQSGKLYDISGNKNYGILDAGIEVGTEQGVVGKATRFSGKLQRIVVNEFARTLKLDTDYSFMFYFKDVSDNPKEFNSAIGVTGPDSNIKLRLSTNNIKNIEDYDDDRWHLFVANIDGKEHSVEYYVDGKKVETKVPSGSLYFDEPYAMSIGYSNILNDYFKGVLDEVRVYSKKLSQDEIEDLYSKIKD